MKGHECTYALQVLKGVKLRTESTVNAEELLVHDRSQRQGAERLHAGIIDSFRVFVLALQLECKVVCQVTAFVVTAKEPESVRVPDL